MKTKGIMIIVFLLAGAVSSILNAQKKQLKINELMDLFYRNGNFNGAIYITENDKPFYQRGFGYADTAGKKAIEADTKFLIASISKQYTAVLIMKLAEEGKLKLTDKLSQFINEYPEEFASKVTLHHMLCNTSGIPDFFKDERYKKIMAVPHTYFDLANIIKDKPLEFEPGTQFKWSNMAWTFLGKVIEKASGKSFEEYFNEKITKPLKLLNTGFVDKDKPIGTLSAQGYVYNFGEYKPAPEYYFYSQISADGIITTPGDLAVFANAVIGGILLSEKSLEQMFTPYMESDNPNMKYGYGWYLGNIIMPDNSNLPVKYLPGGMKGYQSMFVNINNKYSVALFSNYSNAPMSQIINTVANILVGKKYDLPRKPFSSILLKRFKSDGIESMMSELKKINGGDNNERGLTENEMNQLAYEFLNNGLTDESITIFSYITELFPESWNAFDSLGEAYAKKGDTKNAIRNYEESVRLNPDNANGKTAISELGKMK